MPTLSDGSLDGWKTVMDKFKLRVLIVSQTYIVGVNQGKLDAIAKTDEVEVGLLVPSTWKSGGWGRTLTLETAYPNIDIYSYPVLFSGRGGAYIFSPWDIYQTVSAFKPDIVQVEAEVFALCAYQFSIWSQLTGKQLVVFGWENMDRNLPWFRDLVRQTVLNSANLILAGNHDGAKLLRKWGYKGDLEVIPQMGVDVNLFQPSDLKRDLKTFTIGFMGRIVEEKGIDLLIKAAHFLQKQKIQFQISICGAGVALETLQQQASSSGVADLITWHGAVRHEDVPEVLKRFDVLVLPSRTIPTWREQFGHILIEAMSMGIPVVGSSCGEIPNVIGRSDLVFPENDHSVLANILERLSNDNEYWNEVRNYCLDRAQQNFTHEKIAVRLVYLWKQLLENPVREVVPITADSSK